MTRRTLVTAQVAFAFMLLTGAGLLFASFQHVLAVAPGFDATNLLTARVSPPTSTYPRSADVRALGERFLREVQALPGVEHAGLTTNVPFGGDFSDSVIMAEGYQMAPGESLISPYRVHVSAGYMEALRIPLLQGRYFNESDTDASTPVVIVDEALAKKFWPGRDPIGRRMFQPDSAEGFTNPPPDQRYLTVVGVVGETKMAGLVTSDTRAGTYYFPMTQAGARTMTLALRTTGDPQGATAAVRRILTTLDPELPLYGVRTMKERIDETLIDRRAPMMLALGFGAVALLLAAMGLYGVLAYQVSQRRREIGIRMALGSEPRRIFALVLKEGLALMGIGLGAGLAGAFLIGRAMASQLYGVGALEPEVVLLVAAVLAAAALLACTLPARRAARTNPVIALTE